MLRWLLTAIQGLSKWFGDIARAVVTVLQALWVTLRYLFVTYDPQRGTFTEKFEYPERPAKIAARFHGFHRYDLPRCIACERCVKDCPVSCISLKRQKAKERKGFEATEYVIDYSRCMFCGICVEVCPTDCLEFGTAYDMSCYDRNGCVVNFVPLPPEIAWGADALNPTIVALSQQKTAQP